MAKIEDNWKEDRGDMLYGVGPQITRYIEHLYNLKSSSRAGSVWNQAQRMKDERYVAINTVNTGLSSDRFAASRGVVTVTLPTSSMPRAQAYLQAINASHKYAPSRAAGNVATNPALLTALQKGQDTLRANSPDHVLKAAAKELAIRRSCKFGIDYAVKSKAFIHYILDDMDMTIVASRALLDKTIRPLHGSAIHFKKVSICTTELRYLFRNWERYGRDKQVRFYYNLTEVVPPWTDVYWDKSLPHWATYAAHRVDKAIERTRSRSRDMGGIYLQAALRKFCEPFLSARATGKPALEQIRLFHQIPAALVNDE